MLRTKPLTLSLNPCSFMKQNRTPRKMLLLFPGPLSAQGIGWGPGCEHRRLHLRLAGYAQKVVAGFQCFGAGIDEIPRLRLTVEEGFVLLP